MEKHIHLFSTQEEFESAYNGSEYSEPWLGCVEGSETVSYNRGPLPEPDPRTYPLTVEALGSGTVMLTNRNPNVWQVTSYRKNNGEWTLLTSERQQIAVSEGDEVQFKSTYKTSQFNEHSPVISCTAPFNVKGNIMSMGEGDNFENAEEITVNYFYQYFFSGQTTLISAENLALPATSLSHTCYGFMFVGCSSLVVPPELPSTSLNQYCYQGMFDGCTALTAGPELPATNMVAGAYSYMFRNCTSLEVAPELPALTLTGGCYNYMFYGCSSLSCIKALMTATIGINGPNNTDSWVYGVSENGTFVMNRDAEWYDIRDRGDIRNTYGVPPNWAIETA